jgi:hypothetical protein
MAKFDSQWMQRWAARVNVDEVMGHVGRYFDVNVLLDFGGGAEYVVHFRRGRIEGVVGGVGPEECFAFSLRAPRESWENFVLRTPPPMYNDIWAMAHPLHGRLRIEGDVKVMWQNARAFTWALALMREVAP